MEYTNTAVGKLAKLTLGTVQLGMPYGMNNKTGQPSEAEARALLNCAISAGINSLDTAAAYGTSESVIGGWLKTLEADKRPLVTSKIVISGDKGDVKDEMEEALRGSLERLGFDKLPVYMLHRAGDMTAHGDLVAEKMLDFKARGLVGVPGVSVYTADDVEQFLKDGRYGAIQVPMSALDTRLIRAGLIEELKKRGVMIFVRSVFTQGLLCMTEIPEQYACANGALAELREIAEAEGMSLMQMTVSFIRDLPGVTSLVLGCETKAQVEANVKLMEGPALSASAAKAIMELKAPIEEVMRGITAKK